jgi:[acyl-carrier-protein] S-malonyltransferase
MNGQAAFLFPGQGSQRAGMGQDVHRAWPEARAVFAEISAAAGFDVAAACFDASGTDLQSTAVAQPALLAVELSCAEVLRLAGVGPAAVAGHSLGEFAAWAVSGAIARADMASLVVQRGRLMEKEAVEHPGAMAAILGLGAVEIEDICGEAARAGIVVPANLNCPGQVVISGETSAVEVAMRLAQDRGARARALPVAGAFHSPLMAEAAEQFAECIQQVAAVDPKVPVVANATAEWVTTAAELKSAAAAQMTSPVLWESGMRRLLDKGINKFYEVGPGNVLSGLLRRIDPSARVVPAGDAESLRRIVAARDG